MAAMWYMTVAAVTACLWAYTLRFQGATLYWGKELAPLNPCLPRGMQDAITPRVQTVRNLSVYGLIAGLMIWGVALFPWYIALIALMGIWLGSALVAVLFIPRSTSDYFRQRILAGLRRRRHQYETEDDAIRLEAVEDVIRKLEQA